MKFTIEESMLISIFDTGTRNDLIENIKEMQSYLKIDETSLRKQTKSIIDKLNNMTDAEFEHMIFKF